MGWKVMGGKGREWSRNKRGLLPQKVRRKINRKVVCKCKSQILSYGCSVPLLGGRRSVKLCTRCYLVVNGAL
jgi:hypothetical protein